MPDRFHPSQIDDSDWSEEATWQRKLHALGALVVLLPFMGAAVVTIAVLERWRKWRGSDERGQSA